MIPVVDWVNAVINFLRKYEFFNAFTFKDITRALANAIEVPLDFTEAMLHKGFSDYGIDPIAWLILVGLAAIYGWYLKGWRLALLGGGCFFYLALFSKRGIWDLSMADSVGDFCFSASCRNYRPYVGHSCRQTS